MFKAGVGHSEDIDSSDAADEVITQVRTALDGVSPAAGLLFCSINNDHGEILARINAAFPGIELIGGTSYGEVSSNGGFSEESVTLIAFASDKIEMKVGLGRGVCADAGKAARMAVESSIAGMKEAPKLAIVIAESYQTNGAAFTKGLSKSLGDGIPALGGFSADQMQIKPTRQFYGSESLTDCAVVLLFGGPVLFSHGRQSGWAPLGREGVVTRAEGNIVFEIDAKPATEFFSRYLGDSGGGPAEYADYPLMVRENDEAEHCLRSAVSADGNTGTMVFLSEIPAGAKVRISEASRNMIIEGTRQSVLDALRAYPGDEPAAALLFSCAGRRRVLGTRTKEELAMVKSSVTDGLPICGFYTYGEIAPAHPGSRTFYNNDTFVIALIGER